MLEDDIAEGDGRLKQQDGKDIIFGSGKLVRALMEHDLIDEYRLMVFPIIVGKGKHLFEEGEDGRILELVDSKTFGTGVLSLAYRLETS